MVSYLSKNSHTGELVKYSGLTAATISHHMSQLAEALIRLEKIDTKVYYSVNKEMLQKCFWLLSEKTASPFKPGLGDVVSQILWCFYSCERQISASSHKANLYNEKKKRRRNMMFLFAGIPISL